MPLQQFGDLLVAVWQEACRHIDIGESTATITRMLARWMPVDGLLVRELDLARGRLDTLAVGAVSRRAGIDLGPIACAEPEITRFMAWCRRGEVAHCTGGKEGNHDWALGWPETAGAEALVGPLASRPGQQGALVVLGRAGQQLDARHIALVRALLDPFSAALENHHRLRELTALREAAEADKQTLLARLGRTQVGDAIVGAAGGLRPVMERVQLVARSDVPVLILGETGSGKEVVARAIHQRSPRAAGPFMRVNCGAIPPELIDSQLFGHERGSFTGAVSTHKGWFERADGGTLFLDEIGDLPPAAQVRLLRVLQDGQLDRVGGHDSIKVDTRIVAATHRDLTAMVREGRFREDLWYRIAVFPVLLPPLRDRREDIPELVRHFAQRAATRFGLPPQMPSANDLALLAAYAWPGNVRELAAVMDRAAILGNGAGLEIAKALGATTASFPGSALPDAPAPSGNGAPDSVAPLDAAMRRHIESALAATLGRIEGPHGAARVLKVNPHTLRARMRRLGIEWGRFRTRP